MGRGEEGSEAFPMHDVQFALYLQHLVDTTKSKATVEEAVNSISWAHQLAGMLPISTTLLLCTLS